MDGFAGSLDDSISAASTSDVQDRLSALELRVQQQEDEITVLKAALADVLRRLAISEDHVASVKNQSQLKDSQAFEKLFLCPVSPMEVVQTENQLTPVQSQLQERKLYRLLLKVVQKKRKKNHKDREKKKRNLILMITVHKLEHHLLPSPLHNLSKYTDKLQKARILLPLKA